jgi:agmatine deiminase
LEAATDAKGRKFEIIDLPTPRTQNTLNPDRGNERDCDIYSNYILVNGAVISTAFGVKTDDIAYAAFQKAFPGYAIELLDVTTIGLGGGSLHCSTQQQPKTTLLHK